MSPPTLFARVLRHLRHDLRGWTQGQLEQAARLSRGAVSKLERGDSCLDRGKLERLVRVLDLPLDSIDRALTALEQLPSEAPPEVEGIDGFEREIARAASVAARTRTLEQFASFHAARDREAARQLWHQLRRQPTDAQRVLVGAVRRFQTWALSERLCAESVTAAADDAERALHLAALALTAAERSDGPEKQRQRREGYAWAFLGNARRVAGDLPAAERAFARGDQLWGVGEATPAEPLDPSRPLDLRASLRREQGRHVEALVDLEGALQLARTAERKACVALNRAAVLSRVERFDEALDDLAQIPYMWRAEKRDVDLRVRWLVEWNLTFFLCCLARFSEAEDRLRSIVRPLTLELGNGLDQLRVLWLEARVAGGQGRLDEAAQGFREVWQAFAERRIAFDAALAVLELAAVELERGHTREVKLLSSTAAPVFAAQALPRELHAAIQLFWRAAKREAATAASARQLFAHLQRVGPTVFHR